MLVLVGITDGQPPTVIFLLSDKKNPIITVFYTSLWGIAKLVPRWGFVECVFNDYDHNVHHTPSASWELCQILNR